MKRSDKALQQLGFSELKKIQEEMLITYTSTNSIKLIAPTGSGKTLAFLLPILNSIKGDRGTEAIIVAPSRELAIQIEQVFKSFKSGLSSTTCYGGHYMKTEANNLLANPTLIVGTPGRLADHLRRGNIDAYEVNHLVLDEFDKGLELGFEKEMKFIHKELYNVKKRVLVSATEMTNTLPEWTNFTHPKTVKSENTQQNEGELQVFSVRCEGTDKLEILKDLVFRVGNEPTIIFCNHREAVERIGELLRKNKIPVGIFHGALKQEHRERELIKLRNGSSNILITTDLAGRGIDIPAIKNVVHYQIPHKEEVYIHRNGRTARMDADGKSFILLKEDDYLPEYATNAESLDLDEIELADLSTQYTTIYVGAGKKDKINKVDIVGLFYKKGGLAKDELGKIDVLDHCAFVAVAKNKAESLVQNLRKEKVKKKSFKLSISH